MSETLYPEHEKLKLIVDKSQCCGDFLEWLSVQGIYLAQYDTDDMLYLCNEGRLALLSRFFGIDQRALEQEKVAMIESLQAKANAPHQEQVEGS